MMGWPVASPQLVLSAKNIWYNIVITEARAHCGYSDVRGRFEPVPTEALQALAQAGGWENPHGSLQQDTHAYM